LTLVSLTAYITNKNHIVKNVKFMNTNMPAHGSRQFYTCYTIVRSDEKHYCKRDAHSKPNYKVARATTTAFWVIMARTVL